MKSVLYSFLGVSLALAGTAIPAQAQSVILNGDSLRRVENRSINNDNDYRYFYTGGEASTDIQGEASPANMPTSEIAEGTELSVFGENLNLVFGSLVERPRYVELTNSAAIGERETQQLQLLFPVDE
ncbi:MAG: hypothetical protein SAJ72_15585 [Jaaginema sp. PMC 1080.18]|nr:hypothetical protein [Jaaginema sp. PMC 1080.18]MEC4865963.1 hypothetical protein [Jaaginema sp. PMC 1078.18]